MKKFVVSLAAGVFSLALGGAAIAQETTTTTVTKTPTTVTKTTQHPDGSYTIVEYPVGKETIVTLDPVALKGAGGTATILRDDAGTRIKVNLTGVPKEVTTVNLYAIDPTGAITTLGPVVLADGVGSFAGTTPLSKFMIVAAPESTLTAYDPTAVYFRSAVPTGLAVIPHTMAPVGEKVAATTTARSAYTVPMLNIPGYKKGDDTKMKVNFSGALTGARANVFITPRKDGPTEVKFRFHELKDAPAGQVFTVWAISPDNKFVKLGQIVNAAGRNEAEIRSEIAFPDFGLFVTAEDATAALENPAGPSIGFVEIIK